MANKKNTNGPRKEDTENEKTRKYKINKEGSKKQKKNNKGKNKVKKHPILRRIIKIMIILAIMLVIVGAGVFAGIFFGLFGDDFTITKDVLAINKDNSVAVDTAGNVIANLAGDENRKIISMDEMPEYLPKAFVSIEDERFYTHQGVDLKRTAAATVTYIGNKLFGKGSSSFGGSTITQQLVKNLTNEKQDSPTRKVKEMSKAYQVERLISKDQILELYLNLIFLGDKTYGVEVASQYYFSKSAKDLTVAEAAYLAGINHVPNGYKPFEQYADKENAEELKTKMKEKINKRTKTVLNKMKELGAIEEEQFTTAITEVDNGLQFKEGTITTGLASYSYHTVEAINQAKKDLAAKNGWDEEFADLKLRSGGYTIYTTQDSAIQARMEEEYKKETYLKNTRNMGENPVTKEKEHVQSAMTIINHTNGQVVGMVGGLGNDVNAVGVNRAMRPRSTGSSIKPLASVAPSLEAKTMTAATVYDDYPTKFNGRSVKDDGGKYRGTITIREAITYSQNVPQAKAITVLGPLKSIEFLRKIGFSYLVTAAENPSANDESYSLALGGLTNGATTLEMAAGYAMIANDGEYISPTFYTKVVDKDGKTVVEPTQKRERAMSVENAYVLKSILTSPVVNGGTATYCAISGMDVAAKTGTTNDSTDRWLCGFTPYYAGATYFGFDYTQEVKFNGKNPAGLIWSSIMKDIHKDLEKKRFARPDGVVNATVCKKTGLLPSASCETISEVFAKGTVPTETCEGGQSTIICTESGMLVNDNCPAETREEKYVHAKAPNEKNPVWQTSYDEGSGTLPTEICTIHTKKEDKTKPEITLKGEDPVSVLVGTKYTDPGATAKDDVDGDITSKIVIDISKVNMSRTGTYTVTYTVSDKAGNTATKTRKVKVVEKLDKPEKPSNTTNTTDNTNTTNTTQKP